MANRDAQRGFTLPELLISMFILALIFSIMSAAIAQASLISRKTGLDFEVEKSERLASVMTYLIQSAEPVFAFSDDGKRILAFSGTSDELRFVGAPPSAALTPGRYMIAFRASSVPGQELIFSPFANEFSEQHMEKVIVYPFRQAPTSFGFEYGVRSETTGVAWYSDWPFENTIPHFVRFHPLGTSSRDKPSLPVTVRLHRARHDLVLNSEDQFQ